MHNCEHYIQINIDSILLLTDCSFIDSIIVQHVHLMVEK